MLSREEIGILLSFARHPDAITSDWIRRLGEGVDEDELRTLFRRAGLPWSSARGIIGTDAPEASTGVGREAFSPSFWRAIVGTLVALTLAALAGLIGSRGLTLDAAGIAFAFVLVGVVLFKTIARLSSGMR